MTTRAYPPFWAAGVGSVLSSGGAQNRQSVAPETSACRGEINGSRGVRCSPAQRSRAVGVDLACRDECVRRLAFAGYGLGVQVPVTP
jgi:hypothetical protein